MALKARLQQTQSQTLAMTPQLAQSIKLLQLSNADLIDFVQEEIEKNPLLVLDQSEPHQEHRGVEKDAPSSDILQGEAKRVTETVSPEMTLGAGDNDAGLDTSFDNVYDTEKPVTRREKLSDSAAYQGSGTGGKRVEDHGDLIESVGELQTLLQFLEHQISISFRDKTERGIAHYIADGLDEDGYFREPLEAASENAGVSQEQFLNVLKQFQNLEPVGIGARNLTECLGLQLKEADRLDPAMQTMIENLDLLAKHEFEKLRRLCGVEQDDISDMVREIKALDPRPAARFEPVLSEAVTPDVIVKKTPDGNWGIELNSAALPRVLVDNEYYAELSTAVGSQEGSEFISTCMQNANWLTKSLDQRAQTILKVAKEIVAQQDMFFEAGIEHLRPLNLKAVADAIKMHESTISRVSNNKFLMCDQGIYELKYFFSSTVSAGDGEEGLSAESVKHKIKQLIDNENPRAILSDDKLVHMLQETGIEVARRTVAKYREAMRIPSSVQRRRDKKFSA